MPVRRLRRCGRIGITRRCGGLVLAIRGLGLLIARSRLTAPTGSVHGRHMLRWVRQPALLACTTTIIVAIASGAWPDLPAATGQQGPGLSGSVGATLPGPVSTSAPLPPPILPGAIRGARADRPDHFAPSAAPALAAATPTGSWHGLGPAPIGPPFLEGGGSHGGANSGRVTGLAVVASGEHAGRIVAASAGGGIWTSDDNGAHWEPRTDGSADLAMGSVADDPSNPDHLIAGTGEANGSNDSFPGTGILVSSDGGQSWSLQNPGGLFRGADIGQVAIDPSNSSHQFAATSGGLFVTSDGGATWAKPTDPSYLPFDRRTTAVVIDPSTPATVYLALETGVVGKSTDGGVHWTAADAGVTPPSSPGQTALAIAKSSPTTLYASVGSFGGPVGLYKTVNGGASWSQVTGAPNYLGGQGWYDNVLAIDPSNANHLLAGGIPLFETTDGGATWSQVGGIHSDQHALVFRSDGKVLIGDDGGVYLYAASTGTVENANGNLNITQFYFGFNAVNGVVLAGSQDNGSARTSSELEAPWTGIACCDGAASAITPNEPETQFIQVNSQLDITNDGFVSLRFVSPPEGGVFTPPLAVVPNTIAPTEPTVFYGGGNLWRTGNPSASPPTWTNVASGGAPVSAIAASPTNPNVIYVGFNNGEIEVSTDRGLTFSPLAPQPSSQPYVTGLSVNPDNPREVAASFSFDDTRPAPGFPHAALYSYTTSPALGSWSVISGNLPPFAVSRVAYYNGALLAATDEGVYAAGAPAGESTTWKRLGTGMPDVQVQDLNVEPDGIYAVTHGRGAWKLPEPFSLAPYAETRPASEVRETSAALNASVDPNGSEVSGCKFEYGTTSVYGSTAPCGRLPGSGTAPVAASAMLSGLSPNTTYHFRISATSIAGTANGADETFRTAPATCGKTSVGKATDPFTANLKRVNSCVLPADAAVSELSVYLAPGSSAGQQLIKGVLYADSHGSPAALLGTTAELTFTSKSPAGWYSLPFSAPVQVPGGHYWIGVITGASRSVAAGRYDTVNTAEDYNTNPYASGPSNPFGPFTSGDEQMSLYATYTQRLGKANVGAFSDRFVSDRKRTNRYTLATAGSVSKLSVYLTPTGVLGQQLLKGIIYADAGGAPGALLGVSEQLAFANTDVEGWYDLLFSSPLKLAAGKYWIGVITGAATRVAGYRYDNVPGSRDYNANSYASGPSNPFGSFTTDAEQMSLYATYAAG